MVWRGIEKGWSICGQEAEVLPCRKPKGRPKRTFMDVGNEDMKLTGAPQDDGSG